MNDIVVVTDGFCSLLSIVYYLLFYYLLDDSVASNMTSEEMSSAVDNFIDEVNNDEFISIIDQYIQQNNANRNPDELFAPNQDFHWSGFIRNKRQERWSFSKTCCAIGCSRRDFERVC